MSRKVDNPLIKAWKDVAREEMAQDAGFNESDHPRDNTGKFGSGGGAARHEQQAKTKGVKSDPGKGTHGTAFGPGGEKRKVYIPTKEEAEEAAGGPKDNTAKEHSEHDHPVTLSHKGKTFVRTGKVGTHIATGHPSAEYAHTSEGRESRIWQTIHGKINEE